MTDLHTSSQGADIHPLIQPPYNVEAEQALLGALLINNDALERVGNWLEEQHFFEPLHGRIYQALKVRIEKGQRVTPITLKDAFGDEEAINDDLNVPQYLGRLLASATTVINASEYGQTIYDLAARRALMALAQELAERARHVDYANEDSITSIIEDSEAALYQIGDKSGRLSTVVSYGEALRQFVGDLDAAYSRGGGLVGLSSGLASMDEKFGGFAPGDLVTIAGRPGMGKTTLALNIATSMARAGEPVGVFSLEMKARQLAQKNIATDIGIPVQRLRRGDVVEDEFRGVVQLAQATTDWPLYTDQQAGTSIAAMSMRARRMKRKLGIKALFVDYLQLMQPVNKTSFSNRVQEITQITMGLKNLAKELDIPVIALSQLSRAVESRTDKRPQLADLRDSGSIEQDSDIVLFVYRAEEYLKREEPSSTSDEYLAWQAQMDEETGKALVIVAKQRHGPQGPIEMRFDGARSLFYDEGKKPELWSPTFEEMK